MNKWLISVWGLSILLLLLPMRVSAQEVSGSMSTRNFLKQAKDGVVTLTDDVTLEDGFDVTKEKITIDLNHHTLYLNQGDGFIRQGAEVLFKNGTLDVSGYVHGRCVLGIGNDVSSGALMLDTVKVQAKNYYSSYAVFYVYDNSQFQVLNSQIELKQETSQEGGVIKANSVKGKVDIVNSTILFENTVRGFLNGDYTIRDSKITMVGTDAGLKNGINNSNGDMELTIDNSEIAISGCTGRALTIDGITVTIKNGSKLNFSGSQEGDILFKNIGEIKIDDTSQYAIEKGEVAESLGKTFEEMIVIIAGKDTANKNEALKDTADISMLPFIAITAGVVLLIVVLIVIFRKKKKG